MSSCVVSSSASEAACCSGPDAAGAREEDGSSSSFDEYRTLVESASTTSAVVDSWGALSCAIAEERVTCSRVEVLECGRRKKESCPSGLWNQRAARAFGAALRAFRGHLSVAAVRRPGFGPFPDPRKTLDIVVLRGGPSENSPPRDVLGDGRTRVEFINFATYGVPNIVGCVPAGVSLYYEIEFGTMLGEPVLEFPQFGWATADFPVCDAQTNEGAGDLQGSWAVDGQRMVRFGPQCDRWGDPWGTRWAVGDVIGFAAITKPAQNVLQKEGGGEGGEAAAAVLVDMYVSVNGSFDPPNGLAFGDVPLEGKNCRIFPAFTGKTGSCGVNLGQGPWAYTGPVLAELVQGRGGGEQGFCSVAEAACNPPLR